MTLSILNYNCGNIGSITNSLNFLGIKNKVIKTRKDLLNASKLVLPGVGNYYSAIKFIEDNNIRKILLSKLLEERIPTLAICLGMQLLFSKSEENISSKGLGIYKCKIKDISNICGNNQNRPVIGWQKIKSNNSLVSTGFYYFAHSYALDTKDIKKINTNYHLSSLKKYIAYFKDNNILAMQFHPEKSSDCGKEILKKFSEI